MGWGVVREGGGLGGGKRRGRLGGGKRRWVGWW